MLDPTTCVCDNDDVESCDAVPEALEQPKALQPSEAGRYRAWRAAAAAAIIADDMMMDRNLLVACTIACPLFHSRSSERTGQRYDHDS